MCALLIKMWRYLFIASSMTLIDADRVAGPKCPPTMGQVWPRPQQELRGKEVFRFTSKYYQLKIENDCDIIQKAISRHFSHIDSQNYWQKLVNPTNGGDSDIKDVEKLHISLLQPCKKYPHSNMDESYYLTVQQTIELSANSVWGILRGLETIDQLMYLSDDLTEHLLHDVNITDFPRYPYRGYLLDTSRHYVSVSNLILNLDAMEMNKMNVFHWHIVDDPSFPYQSVKFPELSQKGAYYASLIYTPDDIKLIVEEARLRGIRVVPEFDVPGHTRSWGVSHPELMIPCDTVGMLNPTIDASYKLLNDLLDEVQDLFPDNYIHLGGDEADRSCWIDNQDVQEFMKKENIPDVGKLHGYFMKKAIQSLRKDHYPIVWQEAFDEGDELPEEALVQVWVGDGIQEIANVVNAGHKALFSAPWYLDHLGDTFNTFYVDPYEEIKAYVKNQTLLSNVKGGTACMWGEMADDTNFLSRSWPRTSAVAEVLWSAGGPKPDDTCNRIEEHACRMRRRGVPAEPPSGPGFCVVPKRNYF